MVGLEPVTFVGFVAFSFAFWQIRFCAVSRCYVRNETIKLFVRENYQLLCACQECDLSHRRDVGDCQKNSPLSFYSVDTFLQHVIHTRRCVATKKPIYSLCGL